MLPGTASWAIECVAQGRRFRTRRCNQLGDPTITVLTVQPVDDNGGVSGVPGCSTALTFAFGSRVVTTVAVVHLGYIDHATM